MPIPHMPIPMIKYRARSTIIVASLALLLLSTPSSTAQSDLAKQIIGRLEKENCAKLESGTLVCKYNFKDGGKTVEAISFQPAGDGPFPGVLMIPGFEGTARDLVPLGIRFANARLAGVAVSQPGFGKSDGPPDFVGPRTLEVLTAAYRKLQK